MKVKARKCNSHINQNFLLHAAQNELGTYLISLFLVTVSLAPIFPTHYLGI